MLFMLSVKFVGKHTFENKIIIFKEGFLKLVFIRYGKNMPYEIAMNVLIICFNPCICLIMAQ